MVNDNFYAFYCSYQVRATSNVQAMFNSRETLSRCDNFVESEESHSGYRFHIKETRSETGLLLYASLST